MAHFVVYWAADYVRKLRYFSDTGPIQVCYGSPHTPMPSLAKVGEGDCIYAITIKKGIINIMARLEVQKVSVAFDYLMENLGTSADSITPDDTVYEHNYSEAVVNGKLMPPIFLYGSPPRDLIFKPF